MKTEGASQPTWFRWTRWVVFITALAGFHGFLALVLSSLPGCVKQRCYDNLDCPSPMICDSAGRCVYECVTDSDCSPGFLCLAHVCKPNSQGPIVCPDEMVAVADLFCVDKYEASRPDATDTYPGSDSSVARSVQGVIPWEVPDNATAETACQAAGKRLCTPDEWLLACEGPDGTVYAYGDTYEMTTCNGIDAFGKWPDVWLFHLMPTGSFPGCTNEWGVYDINGNLWEHTAAGSDMTIRGGAFNCSDSAFLHRCEYVPDNWTPSARGFRCCVTPDSEKTGSSRKKPTRFLREHLLEPHAR